MTQHERLDTVLEKNNGILRTSEVVDMDLDMPNSQERLLLKYRYFDGCTWEEIGSVSNIRCTPL